LTGGGGVGLERRIAARRGVLGHPVAGGGVEPTGDRGAVGDAGDVAGALALGKKSNDSVARILVYSLNNKEYSLGNAFIRASSQELTRFSQGMATLDTVITSAPLLGLLGTVTGMMKTFGSMQGDIGAAAGQITGGVAEALIATAGGLFIAILALLPFNYINARTEQAKQDISDASHALEIFIKKSESVSSR
jgi:biopolymer transport protein ExbB